MVPHGIQLSTLKECLQFLLGLNNDKKTQSLVAEELKRLIEKYFKSTVTTARKGNSTFLSADNIKSELSKFLGKASDFYARLCYTTKPWTYGNQSAEQLVNALLDCFPKFLAAMYYLWYCIDNTFNKLGGGGWQNDWPGWENRPQYGRTDWGGDLQEYLRAEERDAHKYGGIIPGGFGKNEVRYGYSDTKGYTKGSYMYVDLGKILEKNPYNFFRSVFVSSAVAYSGVNKENTANALSLVRTFCDIVGEEAKKDNGRTLIQKLNEDLNRRLSSPEKSICWDDLKKHCAELRNQISRIFTNKRFDFTGQVTKVSDLNEIELAGKTAEWLRRSLTTVRGKLQEIKEYQADQDFGDYFTKNLFPYGFVFSGTRDIHMPEREVRNSMRDLSTVSKELGENNKSLDRLREILHGDGQRACTKPEPPLPKTEGNQNQGKKAEGAQNQGKKPEGAQNQGKKAEGTSNHVNDQSGRNLPGSPSGKLPAPPPASGKDGDAGPKGPPGTVTPGSSSDQDSTVKQGVNVQTPGDTSPPQSPPATASAPGDPSLPAKPGVGGQDSPGGAPQGLHPAAPQDPARPQTTSVPGSGSGLTGGKGTGLQGGGGGDQGGASFMGHPIRSQKWTKPPERTSAPKDKLDVTGQPVAHTVLVDALPPLSALKLPWQRDKTLTKPLETVTLNEHDMADITHVTGDVIKTPMAQLQGHPNMGISVTPELTGQPVAEIMFDDPDIIPIDLDIERRHETETAPNAQIQPPPTATQGFTKQLSRTTVPPTEWIEPAVPIEASPEIPTEAFGGSVGPLDNVKSPSAVEFLKQLDLNTSPDAGVCRNPWYVSDASDVTDQPTPSPPQDSDHLPPPKTVREMLCWLVGLTELGYVGIITERVKGILREYNKDVSQPPDALEVTGDPSPLTASHVSNTLTQACHYAANVLHRIKYKDISDEFKTFFEDQKKYAFYSSSDPACLLCQLRDYVYACYHQLTFLKSQCYRNKSQGGWQNCPYGRDVSSPKSPLQAFLTDAADSKFKTDPFDPRDICRKSRVNMGFKQEHLPATHETGKHISTILTPTCGGDDPLLTLASYLNCLTQRTPRTTGELVSFFHNFGNTLHDVSSDLSLLGSALSKRHDDCPRWDCLGDADLQAVQGIRGSATPTANHDKDKNHAKTLSTLLGCDIDNSKCPQLMKPITYGAYAPYSSTFVHTYLSWAAYLAGRLWESLLKLYCDLEKLKCHDSKSLHQAVQ
ncbi:ribosome binding protein [Babesia ovata]|uniref:Ribosome binding protein n=1 Tax=Babesia ovata TaxID=189622 RepID=A0A2H6KII2_9APIC|nr:ribosome binding protein [Babesia ovata]GBE62800.1 ribosome binding protein [Babesia ovata]